jgi:hypothetical protein
VIHSDLLEEEVSMAVTAAGTGLLAHFSALEVPQQSGKILYPLPEILLVVLCGTLSGVRRLSGISVLPHFPWKTGFESVSQIFSPKLSILE